MAQKAIPIVYAVSYTDSMVNWPDIKERHEREAQEGDPPFFYRDCALGIYDVSAAHAMKPENGKSYAIKNLMDDNPLTAWIPVKNDHGIGESFTVVSKNVNGIYNGYQATPDLWKKNSRVKKMKVYKNGEPLCFLVLADKMDEQYFDLSAAGDYATDTMNVFKFEIMEVYPGSHYKETAISEITWSGCCFAGDTWIESISSPIEIRNLQKEQKIISPDLDDKGAKVSEVKKISKQVHVKMLKVSTAYRSIVITPDHPLFVKGKGFISFARLKRELNLESYSDLTEETELLVWDSSL